MLTTLRTLLRRLGDALKPAARKPATIPLSRVDLMLRAVALNAQRRLSPTRPASFAMLEVMLRELTLQEMSAALHRMEPEERTYVDALLERMREDDSPQEALSPEPVAPIVETVQPPEAPLVSTRPLDELTPFQVTLLHRARLESQLVLEMPGWSASFAALSRNRGARLDHRTR